MNRVSWDNPLMHTFSFVDVIEAKYWCENETRPREHLYAVPEPMQYITFISAMHTEHRERTRARERSELKSDFVFFFFRLKRNKRQRNVLQRVAALFSVFVGAHNLKY